MHVTIFTPGRFVGAVMQLAQEKRGVLSDHKYRGDQAEPGTGRYLAELTYLIPLSDIIIDFFDRLKSITEGYASLDYEFYDYQPVKVVKVDIMVNKEKVDALSFLVVEDQAQRRSRQIVERLAAAIPRQQFEAPVQAAIGGQIIARADIKAFRKDVTQKLYGGDRSRKDKLLDKQKKGKARLKLIGRVGIPQSAFFTVLRNS
jgi:GTP-binding protein LepA